MCLATCPSLYQTKSLCLYDTDHTTLLKDVSCYDAHPATPYGLYCIATEEGSSRDQMLSFLFSSMNVLRRGAGDLLVVTHR